MSPPCPLGLAEQLADGMFVPVDPAPVAFHTYHGGHLTYRIAYGECTEIAPPLLPADHKLFDPPLRIAYDCWDGKYEVFQGGRRVKTFHCADVDAIPALRPFLRATHESCAAVAGGGAPAAAQDGDVYAVAFGDIPLYQMQTAEHPDPATFQACSLCGVANTATQAMELAQRAATRYSPVGSGIGIFPAKGAFLLDDLRGLRVLRWAPLDGPKDLLVWVECPAQ